ncbi:MAG: ABC transporter permease [Bacillaceae bacterium]|nr:ABC transporter permease [Bacillaceae bacterium]
MNKVKVENKRFTRSILSNIRAFLSIVLIIAIGVGFFISLKTILIQYETTTESYFESQNLADYTLTGVDFDQKDVETLGELASVEGIIGRVNVDVKRNETVLRVLSLPQDREVAVNIPYLYQGTMPSRDDEILVSNKYATEHHLSIGDRIEIFYANQFVDFVVSGIVASPEYVYLAQSASMPMVDPYDFGIIYVNEGFFFREEEPMYNELMIKFSEDVTEEVAIAEIHQRLEKTIIQATKKENQTVHDV